MRSKIMKYLAAALAIMSFSAHAASDIYGGIGLKDSQSSYYVGMTFDRVAVEVTSIESSNTVSGVDALYIIPANMYPIDPYVGVGIYNDVTAKVTGTAGIRYHFNREIAFGMGYHTMRGANLSLHFKF